MEIRNVGGISESTLTFHPGLTVLAGRNATNRTSLLRAIMGVCGSNRFSLKGDSEGGEIQMAMNGEKFHREIKQSNGGLIHQGDPFLDPDDIVLAELFAFLLESNEARRAVDRGADFRDLIMRPVDTEAIKAEIDQLIQERTELDNKLDELERESQRLPKLEERKIELEDQIEECEAALKEKRDAVEETDVSIESGQEVKTELQDQMEELQELRDELTGVRQRLEAERRSVSSLEAEYDELKEEYDNISTNDNSQTIAEIENELERLRERRRIIGSQLSDLSSVIQFNNEMLDEPATGLHNALQKDVDADDVTQELLPANERQLVCWTCGSTVERPSIEETIHRLRSIVDRINKERSELDSKIDELEVEKKDLKTNRRDQSQLERRLKSTEEEIEDRRRQIAELEEKRDDLENEITDAEAAVTELQQEDNEELLSLQREVTELDFELNDLQTRRRDIESEIDGIEERLTDREEIEENRKEVTEKITELRNRIDRIEEGSIEQFNEKMAEVLDILNYENIERIWIERAEGEVREGRRKVTKSQFKMHVVRTSESGTAYEDTVAHLSESEREVTGLVFALAGYLVHEVHEVVPFMLLDSLEAIDAPRIADLIDFISDFSDYLIVALLIEDAQALDVDHQRITDI